MTGLTREIFVISDLHIGGQYANADEPDGRGFRICTHVAELASFIRQLAQRGSAPGRPPVELVLNGDIVDFLAEEGPDARHPWRPFIADANEALDAFATIATRDSAFFSALAEFLARGQRLTVLLGNHDVELSLPAVRREFERRLGVDATPGRYCFLYDGEAYTIGDLLIEHGNRYDGWNTINHDGLRRIRSSQSRRTSVPEPNDIYVPPVGSRLVAQVMNEIKRDYPFIDLLKPEQEAVLPLLLAFEPGYLSRLRTLAALAWEKRRHEPRGPAAPRQGGEIAALQKHHDGQPTGEMIARRIDTSIAEHDDPLVWVLSQCMGGERRARFLETIAAAARESELPGGEIAAGRGPVSRAVGLARLLAPTMWPWAQRTFEQRLPALLDALQVLQEDRTFDLDGPCGELHHAQELLRRGFKAVVFGHTHLARYVSLGSGGMYLNTGTWADVMRFPSWILSLPRERAVESLGEFARALASGQFGSLIDFRPTYAYVALDGDGHIVSTRLLNARLNGLPAL
jgi:UDP-2,3-diacylglucosamine pyrophosphatase LpxH